MIGASTVFVVDDDPSVLRAISRLLRLDFAVRTYDSPLSFVTAITPDTPGCVLLELALPGVSGLEVQMRLIEAGCLQPVIFLSGHGSVQTTVQAMRAGAEDFLEKPCDNDALLDTVRRALERDREARAHRNGADSMSRRIASLTPREDEVFRDVIAGRLNKQIAARLGAAEKTIEIHRAGVMHEMSVRSVAELTRIAQLIGIRPEPQFGSDRSDDR